VLVCLSRGPTIPNLLFGRQVVSVRAGRWSYMIDGEFPADLYDSTWGLTTFPSPEDAQRAAESRVART
jgi:hypothetical protein